jgi:hypothetical protein
MNVPLFYILQKVTCITCCHKRALFRGLKQLFARIQAIELASTIKGASLVTLDTDNHILRAHEPAMEAVLERIRVFVL